MPGTMTSQQMERAASKPVALDLDSAPAPSPAASSSRERARGAARKAAGPPKDVESPGFVTKESRPVRVTADDPDVYSIWNCPTSPNEKIRVSDERLIQFRFGTLKCKTAGDDEAVRLANQYAAGRYIPADPDLLDNPIKSKLGGRTTYWFSRKAAEQHEEQYERDHA